MVSDLIMSGLVFAPRTGSRSLEATQCFGMLFEELREVGQHFDGGRAEMMFDALDVLPLRFGVETEE